MIKSLMVFVDEIRSKRRQSRELLRIGGYLILLGSFAGLTLQVYGLLNPHLFAIFNGISQYEATSFFLAAYLPSFIVIVAVGYAFAVTPSTQKFSMPQTAMLCFLALLALALSALSILNFMSLFGAATSLIAIIMNHTMPTFKALWKREGCFFVETGAIAVAASSVLFLLTSLIAGFLQTYSPGVYGATYGYAYLLMAIVILALLAFFATPFLCLQGSNFGLSALISLAVAILSVIIMSQNQYDLLNLSAIQGILLAGGGTLFLIVGTLIHTRLFLSEFTSPVAEPSFRYMGKYCPYCGAHWLSSRKLLCPVCGKDLSWELGKPFCPHCGRLKAQGSKNCPHCGEYVADLPIQVSPLGPEEERAVIQARVRARTKPGKIQRTFDFFWRGFDEIVDRTGLLFQDAVYMGIVIFLLAFLLLFASVRIESEGSGWASALIFHYGFPLEWLYVWTAPPQAMRMRFTLVGAVADFALCFFSAFAIIYAFRKFYDRI